MGKNTIKSSKKGNDRDSMKTRSSKRLDQMYTDSNDKNVDTKMNIKDNGVIQKSLGDTQKNTSKLNASEIDQNFSDRSSSIKTEPTVETREENSRKPLSTEIQKQDDIFTTPTKGSKLIGEIKEENVQCETHLGMSALRRKYERSVSESESHCSPFKKKRRISLECDSDELCDIVKSELCNTSHMTEFEAIDMVHDLDTVMNFDDMKEAQNNYLRSPEFRACIGKKEYNHEIANDPQSDPLYIDDSEKKSKDSKKKIPTKFIVKKQPKIKFKTRVKPVSMTAVKYKTKLRLKYENPDYTETEMHSADEDPDISTDWKETMYNLNIQLLHCVPPQHNVEPTAGSKAPNSQIKRLFESYGPIKTGIFSPNEDDIIKRNWNRFCKVHNWDTNNVEPFLYMRHKDGYYIRRLNDRKKFVQFLANGLPWRTLHSVYSRFRNLYQKRPKSYIRYSADEDKKIIAYARKKIKEEDTSRMFSELAKILGRTRRSIWLRYQYLLDQKDLAKNPINPVTWTIPLITKFIRHLIDLTLSEDIRELKDAVIPKPVWLKLEQKMNVHHDVLRKFWLYQLHMQLFCPNSIYLNDIKIQLIEYFYGKGIANTREILWPNVALHFEGMTTVFLCKIFFHLVREVALKYPKMSFADTIDYLYEKKISEIIGEITDKYLPRLIYVDGKLEIVSENEKSPDAK